MPIDPFSDNLAYYLREMDRRISNIERTRQYYFADWIQLNQYEYSYSSSNVILVTDFDPTSIVTDGDKLRIKQNGATTYSYYKITNVTSTTIEISQGTGNALTNTTIDEIWFSKFVQPAGFPNPDDWDNSFLDPTQFVYFAGSRLFVGYDPRTQLAIGDRIRLKDDGSGYKYFVIIAIGSNYIELSQGSLATLSGSTITEIGFSKYTQPNGFPVPDDWTQSFYLDATKFSFNSATQMGVTLYDPRTQFTVGDKVKMIQSGVTKYFYVTGVGSNYVQINAGTSYTFTSGGISSIYISKGSGAALGFPDSFAYTTTASLGSGTLGTEYTKNFRWYMSGNNVTVNYSYGAFVNSGTWAPQVKFTLPFNNPNAQNFIFFVVRTDNSLASSEAWQAKLNTTQILIEPLGGGATTYNAATQVIVNGVINFSLEQL